MSNPRFCLRKANVILKTQIFTVENFIKANNLIFSDTWCQLFLFDKYSVYKFQINSPTRALSVNQQKHFCTGANQNTTKASLWKPDQEFCHNSNVDLALFEHFQLSSNSSVAIFQMRDRRNFEKLILILYRIARRKNVTYIGDSKLDWNIYSC